ncbi:hypothetical protein [uncultured Winogradskyella sp.]|uniref:hypothetical protein n=1 Tax=uncultured Winogradskyella sp. TaxID=395353 RepID=UPI0026253ADF|nr:hypothetical protein [uncultured Winogradskyella sp.]
MKRKDILILIAINIVLTNIFAYFDYDGEGFNYIIEMWHLLLISLVVFMILPMVLLWFFRKSKYRILIASIGFLPVLFLIGYLL